jgi:CxxC-x17-CxxC domain-containing protein
MRNFSNGNKFGGSRGGSRFGGRNAGKPRFNSRNAGGSTMHDAICGECGNNCKVPFIPSGDRPVYCSDCFEKRAGSDDSSRAPRRSTFDRPAFPPKRSFPAPAAANNHKQENYNEKFDQLNAKMDKILKTLNFIINKDTQEQENPLPAIAKEIESILDAEMADEAPAKKKKAKAKKVAKTAE